MKRFVTLGLLALFVLILAACGGGGEPSAETHGVAVILCYY